MFHLNSVSTKPAAAHTTFSAPKSVSTFAYSINKGSDVAGYYLDAAGVAHGFLRNKNGRTKKVDAPEAGTGSGQGTFAFSINNKEAVTGYYIDASNIDHGFVGKP